MYFIRGYREWVCLPLALANFSILMFNFTLAKRYFANVLTFALCFAPIFTFICWLVGWLDLNYGTYADDQRKMGKLNPNWDKLLENSDETLEILKGLKDGDRRHD